MGEEGRESGWNEDENGHKMSISKGISVTLSMRDAFLHFSPPLNPSPKHCPANALTRQRTRPERLL